MVAPLTTLRNASQGLKAKGRAKEGKSGKPGAAKGHYESRGPVGSGQSEGRAAWGYERRARPVVRGTGACSQGGGDAPAPEPTVGRAQAQRIRHSRLPIRRLAERVVFPPPKVLGRNTLGSSFAPRSGGRATPRCALPLRPSAHRRQCSRGRCSRSGARAGGPGRDLLDLGIVRSIAST